MLGDLKGATNLHEAYQRRLKECVTNLSLKGEAVVSRTRSRKVLRKGEVTETREPGQCAGKACLGCLNHRVGWQWMGLARSAGQVMKGLMHEIVES